MVERHSSNDCESDFLQIIASASLRIGFREPKMAAGRPLRMLLERYKER